MTYSIPELSDILRQKGKKLNQAQEVFCRAKMDYVRLYNARKTVFARVLSDSEGKTHADRERNAQLNEVWENYNNRITEAECAMIEAQKDRDIADTDHTDAMMLLSGLKKEMHTFSNGGD